MNLIAIVGFALALLTIVAGTRYLILRSKQVRRRRFDLSDEEIRVLEMGGTLHVADDDPLDLSEIREEEDRFWKDEQWDEAEPWANP
jgi:hypothetical protein